MSFIVEFYKFLRNEEFFIEVIMMLSFVFGFLYEKSFDEFLSVVVEVVVSLFVLDKFRGLYIDIERDVIVLDYFLNDLDFYIEYII